MEEHITVSTEECIVCSLCVDVCPASPCVFEMTEVTAIAAHPEACEQCMLCIENCPTNAIAMTRSEEGESNTLLA